jgi:small-conductance mechanosensitive channel
MRRSIFCLLWLAAIGGLPAAARDQVSALDSLLGRTAHEDQPAAETAAARKPSDELHEKREAVAERLSVAQRTVELTDKPSTALTGEVERLKRLDVLYAQQQSALLKIAELETQKSQAAEQLQSLESTGVGQPPPYKFALLDQLRDELETLHQRAASTEAAMASATDALKDAKSSAAEAHRKHRKAGEGADAAAAKLAELDAQIADAQVTLAKSQLAGERLARETIELSVQLVDARLAIVAPQTALSDQEQQDKLVELDREEAELRDTQRQAETRLGYLSQRLGELELAAAPTDRKSASAELEARRAACNAQQQYVTLLNRQLERLALRREAWLRRFAVHRQTAGRGELSDWARQARETLEQLARDQRLAELKMHEIRSRRVDLEKRAQEATDDALSQSLAEQLRVERELMRYNGQNITSLERSRRVHERLLAEIEANRLTLAERLHQVWSSVAYVWNYELVVADGEPVTVSMVVWGLVLLVLGLFVSRYASRAIGKRLLPRLGVHESAAGAMQAISFYTFVTLATLLALQWVNVPLTLFTFLGGAVAIGVGFGSQNLVNNFISGLILLAERPIRVGDVIEIDALVGTVDAIGARSTRIRTGNNFEIIVPNSSLLERNVVNWTLSDQRVKCTIPVGVAYGSNTREVARWLKKSAEEHGLVLDRPEPFVLFVEFGDNALQFELHYWIEIRALAERRRVESDLRFIIDQYFRDAGLVIAYPQRDLHLSNDAPLKVAILPPAASLSAHDEDAQAA